MRFSDALFRPLAIRIGIAVLFISAILTFRSSLWDATRAIVPGGSASSRPSAGGVALSDHPNSVDGKFTDRIAVLIEDRPFAQIPPMMLHFLSVLGPRWPMVLYTREASSKQLLDMSPVFRRAVTDGQIQIRLLPDWVQLKTHHDISVFLTNPWLWEDLAPAAKVFMFQLDSIICANAPHTIDDFLHFDLIGAPIPTDIGRGFNGGLCIRNRAVVLDLVRQYSYPSDSEKPDAPFHMKYEDQWLYTRMSEMPPKPDGSPAVKIPTIEEAMNFSSEFIWTDRPLGYHQPDRVNPDKFPEIMSWCPEAGMMKKSEGLNSGLPGV